MEKKYSVQGIIGCLLFGIGDWLLGYVDPKKVPYDVFYFISTGHGAGYSDWKITVTMVCRKTREDLDIKISRAINEWKK